MNKTATLFVACLCLGVCFRAAYGGDLNAPGAKVVTVKSEIERGVLAVMHCGIGYQEFSNGLNATENANEQANTDSPGFKLGFDIVAWQQSWYYLSTGSLSDMDKTVASLMASTRYARFKAEQQALGLTEDQVTEVIQLHYRNYKGRADDEKWEAVSKSQSFLHSR